MKTSFAKKPSENPLNPEFLRSIGIQAVNVIQIHTSVTRAQHNMIVEKLRIHVDCFIEESVLLPQYLAHSMMLFEQIYTPDPSDKQHPRMSLKEYSLKNMRTFMTAFISQCDTIIPIVFADEEGAAL